MVCVGYFVRNFKGSLCNATQNILPIHWKMCILFRCWNLRALRLKHHPQGGRSHGSTNHRFWPKFGVSGLELQFEFTNGYKWYTKLEVAYRMCPIVFQGHLSNFKVTHGGKNHWFWPKLEVSGLWLQFGFSDGYGMMHEAWSSIENVPCCFSKSSVKFQGHTGQKITIFDPNLEFPDCNSSLNSPMALKWCTKLNIV